MPKFLLYTSSFLRIKVNYIGLLKVIGNPLVIKEAKLKS